ncbi:8330_t:CDS:1, partial [Acaulospora morrowiae]
VDNVIEIFNAADFFLLEKLRKLAFESLKRLCNEDGNESKSPELLSRMAKLTVPLDDGTIADCIINSMTKISFDTLGFGRLSLEGLHHFLSKSCEKSMQFVSSEYSILRFAILTAASTISHEAFLALEKRLPTWEKVNGYSNNILTNKKISESVTNILGSLFEYIDFRRIDAKILEKIIEPLHIVPSSNIVDSYRLQACEKTSFSAFRGLLNFKWDKNSCSPTLNISNDGYTVTASQRTKEYQCVRTNIPMSSGIHELCILIERTCNYSWIGICGDAFDPSKNAKHQRNAWVLCTSGELYHNNEHTKVTQNFDRDNTKIVVQIDIKKSTLTFTINEKRCSTSIKESLPSKLYFYTSLRYPGIVKILPR